jgi:AraC family transcriptional regulator
MITRQLRLEANRYAAGTRHALHEHDELQISVVLRGTVREVVGNSVVAGAALSVVVKDPGVRHADDFGQGGALMARLSLRNAEFSGLVESAGRATAWRWTRHAQVAAPFLRIIARGNAGQRAFCHDDNDVVDLVAAISARPSSATGAPPAWLAGIVTEMTEGWSAELSVTGMAKRAGVHPVYLARCIRRWYGVSAGDVLREARLSRAAEALAAGNDSVSTIAHESGFSDEAHFCRSLAAAAGITPGRFRREARAFAG